MKANFVKVDKELRRMSNYLRFKNQKIGKEVSRSTRLPEEKVDEYLGLSYDLFDLMKHIDKVRERIGDL